MLADESDLLTVKETAQLLRVSPATVWRWIAKGRLKACRLPSGTLRVPQSQVRALRDSGTKGPRESDSWIVYQQGDPNADWREVSERMKRNIEEQRAARGGVPYSNSAPIIREAREEWARQKWPDDP